jgi:hypothetical protein
VNDAALTRRRIVAQLSAAVGDERAEELVAEQAAALRVRGAEWSDRDAAAVVERLAALPGVVGLTARRLQRRPSAKERDVLAKLVALLGEALGEAKARDLVDGVIARRGLDRTALDRADALVVLEELASMTGLVGTVARFAKARALLELG